MYNYHEEVKANVLEAIRENYSNEEIAEKLCEDRDDFAETLNEEFWIDDNVTGNASGSYWFNTWKAEEALAHNWDLIVECAQEFGIEPTIEDGYEHGAEWWDVSIRCYLLPGAIAEALDELEEDETISAMIEQLENAEV